MPPSNDTSVRTPSAADPLLPRSTANANANANANTNTQSPSTMSSSSPSSRPSSFHYTFAALSGASAVALGAFGAHGLKRHIADPARLANWATAAQYQLIHSGVLLAVAGLDSQEGKQSTVAKNLLAAGTVMFSGSLYGLVLLGPGGSKAVKGLLGPVTPLGGLCLIAGWVGLAWR